MKNPESDFAKIVAELGSKAGVTPPSADSGPRSKFGSRGLKLNGRIFAMLSPEKRLIVKLPRLRVEALVASGDGVHYDPRHDGRLMKEWLVLKPSSKIKWLDLATEAMMFADSSKA